MNMQTSDTQNIFSQRSMCSQSPSSNCKTHETCRFHRAHWTLRTHQTHGKVSVPQPSPMYILSMTSTIWNISVGQLGLVAWLVSLLALVHLLIGWTWET